MSFQDVNTRIFNLNQIRTLRLKTQHATYIFCDIGRIVPQPKDARLLPFHPPHKHGPHRHLARLQPERALLGRAAATAYFQMSFL